MQNDRLNQLLEWLAETPDDPFLIYAAATEYREKEPLKALQYYEKLLNEQPDYFAVYYHAAALYEALDREKEAEETYRKGIEVCSRLGEHHALRELRAAYEEFSF